MKILAVHGLGGWEQDLTWQSTWRNAFTTAVQAGGGAAPEVEFLDYDDIFADARLTVAQTLRAVGMLLGSALGLGSRRGLVDEARTYWRFYAGMVVQWVEDEKLRAETRSRLVDRIRDFKPDLIAGHSLGSLIAYDAASHPRSKQVFRERTLVTLGSQVGNAFVVGQFLAGRIQPLEESAFWYHLYNEEDDVFTAPINLPASNFRQVDTSFDIPGWADHDAIEYIRHPNAIRYVWSILARPGIKRALPQTMPAGRVSTPAREPRHRALIIGIDEYPNPDHRLSGCVNDAYLMSSVLQETGFEADDIRMLLNERATAAGILERIAWLLEDVRDDDALYLHYSGHGSVLPSYNADYAVEQVHECLVPYDFDGSATHAITDVQLCELYSQIPYDASLILSLDCCHAGGLVRGSTLRVRGLDPPDDVRHRMLRWDKDKQLWVQRQMKDLRRQLGAPDDRSEMFVGASGSTMRIGSGMSVRTLPSPSYDKIRKERKHRGPYMPVTLLACGADELAQEYLHGSISYGAFTYVAAKVLRAQPQARIRRLTYRSLVEATRAQLNAIGLSQTPSVSGPEAVLVSPVPWRQT